MINQKPKKSPLDHLIFFISVTVILVMSEATHVSQGSIKDTEFCEVSKLTKTVVDNCPTDSASLMEAANRKNCSAIKSTCLGRLEYHCVINPWGNLTLEVCAPATQIRKGFCAEYNEGGGKIQEYYVETCPTCEKKYLSTDAYKYPECYSKTKVYAVKESQDSFPQYPSLPAENGGKTNILENELFCIQILLAMVFFWKQKYI